VTVRALDPGASGWFDLDALPILQEARRTRLAAARTGFDMGVPFNELNRVLDLGFKALPWGDRGYVAAKLQEVGRETPPGTGPEAADLGHREARGAPHPYLSPPAPSDSGAASQGEGNSQGTVGGVVPHRISCASAKGDLGRTVCGDSPSPLPLSPRRGETAGAGGVLRGAEPCASAEGATSSGTPAGDPLAQADQLLSTLQLNPGGSFCAPVRSDKAEEIPRPGELRRKLGRFFFEQRGRALAALERWSKQADAKGPLLEPAAEEALLLARVESLAQPQQLPAFLRLNQELLAQLERALAENAGQEPEQLAACVRTFYNQEQIL
jgi:hypothetical protein